MPRPLQPDEIEALTWLERKTLIHNPRATGSMSTWGKQRYVKPSNYEGLDQRLCRPQMFSGMERRGLVASAEFGEHPLHERPRKWREYCITQAGADALAQIKEA